MSNAGWMLLLLVAAGLEAGGDALVRLGLSGSSRQCRLYRRSEGFRRIRPAR